MIELIYNEEEASVEGESPLLEPKNRKQIGEPREYKKIFIEDYVHTYLLQYSSAKEPAASFAILLGKTERSGGKRHLYIQSAMTIEGIAEKQGKYMFTEKVWGDIYQECEKYFPGQEIMGWFLAKPGFPIEKDAVMEETHRTYFSGAEKVLFLLEPLECESGFYGFDGNRFARQPGYYVYYEKNEMMRDFIMAKNAEQKKVTSTEKPDLAVANFRKIIREKQERAAKRKKLVIAYGTRTTAALLLLGGVWTLKTQTEKIAKMEQQMNAMEQETETAEVFNEEVVVEELPGNVKEQPVLDQTESEEMLPVTQETAEVIQEETPDNAEEAAVTYVEYIVQEGDTLAKICREHYGTDGRLEEVCALNEIRDGDYIQAGEIILLP